MSAARRKDTNTNGAGRPLMPRLAASAQPRATPSPKLAGSAPPPTRLTSTQTTPAVPTLKTFVDEKSTPLSNFVNANITPRSSSRSSRADSSNSTPVHDLDDTPSRARPASTLGLDSSLYKSGHTVPDKSAPDLNRVKTQHAFLQSKHRSLPASPRLAQSPERDHDLSFAPEKPNHFFYASEGPIQESIPTRPQHKKKGSFVYADGSTGSDIQAPLDAHTQLVSATKEFKNIHTVQPSQQQQTRAGLRVKAPTFPATTIPQQARQPSPPRPGFHLTYRKGASQVIPPSPISPPIADFDLGRKRESSIDDDRKRESLTFSVSSVGSGEQTLRKETGFPFSTMFSLPSAKNSPVPSPTRDIFTRTSTDRDILQALDPDVDHTQSPPSVVGSSGSDPQRAEAAAHARRERKIMDLEISNSSLLVINRSLEKEIRRQKADLRRYKRLSRKSSLDALRVSSGRLSILTEDSEAPQSDGEEEEQSEEEHSSSSESFSDEPMSPGAIAQRDIRHRKHDQRRLQKDLAKHKDLLVDSQRMNQSLRKCLNVTETLIKEGNKALEYRVNHEDVQLGGRVLDADELTGDASRSPTPFDNTDRLGDPPPVDGITDVDAIAMDILGEAF